MNKKNIEDKKLWSCFLEVTPFGKGRPRLGKNVYTPAKTRKKEAEIKYLLNELENVIFFEDKPLKVSISFFFNRPKSVSPSRVYPTVKPDIDNLVKLVLDSANGIIYKDDKQVVQCLATKSYVDQGEFEGISFTVEEL